MSDGYRPGGQVEYETAERVPKSMLLLPESPQSPTQAVRTIRVWAWELRRLNPMNLTAFGARMPDPLPTGSGFPVPSPDNAWRYPGIRVESRHRPEWTRAAPLAALPSWCRLPF